MKNIRAYAALSFVVVASLILSLNGVVHAAGPNGYKVSPVRTDLTVEPGNSKTFPVYVTNITAATESLQVVINDFQANANETGQPALLLNGQDAPSHGLRKYITIPGGTTFSLAPKQQKAVTVQIAIPKNAPGGGYYGAIRFAPAGLTGEKNVNLAASVASLVLVRVPGQITEQLSIASFDVRQGDHPRILFTAPHDLQAVVRFQNAGNVQEQPFGKILLKHGSKVLGTYEINTTDPRGNILPDSIRRFSVNLNHVGSFGKFTVVGNFGYGTQGQLLSGKTTFYVIPLAWLIVGLVLIALILVLVFAVPRWLRNYRRRILREAGRR